MGLEFSVTLALDSYQQSWKHHYLDTKREGLSSVILVSGYPFVSRINSKVEKGLLQRHQSTPMKFVACLFLHFFLWRKSSFH
jgi:hypothetical protein